MTTPVAGDSPCPGWMADVAVIRTKLEHISWTVGSANHDLDQCSYEGERLVASISPPQPIPYNPLLHPSKGLVLP